MKVNVLYVSPKLPGGAITVNREYTNKDLARYVAVSAVYAVVLPHGVLASPITEKMAKASQPLKDLLLGLADPVCYVVFCWGLLECMLGKAESGIKRMKYATLGYIGLNWVPDVMTLLRQTKP